MERKVLTILSSSDLRLAIEEEKEEEEEWKEERKARAARTFILDPLDPEFEFAKSHLCSRTTRLN